MTEQELAWSPNARGGVGSQGGGVVHCDSPADAQLAARLGNLLGAFGCLVDGPQAVALVRAVRLNGWLPAVGRVDVVDGRCGPTPEAATGTAASDSK